MLRANHRFCVHRLRGYAAGVLTMLNNLAQWLIWQLDEFDRVLDHPPARITVVSGSRSLPEPWPSRNSSTAS